MKLTKRYDRILADLNIISDALNDAKHAAGTMEDKVSYGRSVGKIMDSIGRIRLTYFDIEDAEKLLNTLNKGE